MVLRYMGIVLCGVELVPLNHGGEALKIRINDERDRQLLLVVLKEDFVLTFFPASPPARLSGLFHDSRVYGLPADPPLCSRAGSASRSACAPCACFGHGEGGWGL